jgi:cbb3-type cytochrome oxidase subunit 3
MKLLSLFSEILSIPDIIMIAVFLVAIGIGVWHAFRQSRQDYGGVWHAFRQSRQDYGDPFSSSNLSQ